MYYDSYLYNNIQLLYSMHSPIKYENIGNRDDGDEDPLDNLRNMSRALYNVGDPYIRYAKIDIDPFAYKLDTELDIPVIRSFYEKESEFKSIISNAYYIFNKINGQTSSGINFDDFKQIVSNLPENDKKLFAFTRIHDEGVDTIFPDVKSHSINGVTLLLHLIKLKDEVKKITNVTKEEQNTKNMLGMLGMFGKKTTTIPIPLKGEELGKILTENENNKQIMEILKIHAIDGPVNKDIFCKTYNSLDYEKNKQFLINRYFEAIYSQEAFQHHKFESELEPRIDPTKLKQYVKLFKDSSYTYRESEDEEHVKDISHHKFTYLKKTINIVVQPNNKDAVTEDIKTMVTRNNNGNYKYYIDYFQFIVDQIDDDVTCLSFLREHLNDFVEELNGFNRQKQEKKRKENKKIEKDVREYTERANIKKTVNSVPVYNTLNDKYLISDSPQDKNPTKNAELHIVLKSNKNVSNYQFNEDATENDIKTYLFVKSEKDLHHTNENHGFDPQYDKNKNPYSVKYYVKPRDGNGVTSDVYFVIEKTKKEGGKRKSFKKSKKSKRKTKQKKANKRTKRRKP